MDKFWCVMDGPKECPTFSNRIPFHGRAVEEARRICDLHPCNPVIIMESVGVIVDKVRGSITEIPLTSPTDSE